MANINYSGTGTIQEIFKTVKKYLDLGLSKKVDTQIGYGLSQENYTPNDMEKLAGIEDNAQVNILEGISVNGTNATIANKIAQVTVPTQISQLIVDPNDSSVKVLTTADGVATEAYVEDIETNLSTELGKKANTSAVEASTLTLTLNGETVGEYKPYSSAQTIDFVVDSAGDPATIETQIPLQNQININFPISKGLYAANGSGVYTAIQSSNRTKADAPYPLLWSDEILEDTPADGNKITLYKAKVVDITNSSQIFPSIVSGQPIYLKGKLASNTSTFVIADSDYIIIGEPTWSETYSQYNYMLLGFGIDSTHFYFQENHPLYSVQSSTFQPLTRINSLYQAYAPYITPADFVSNTDSYSTYYPYKYTAQFFTGNGSSNYFVDVIYGPSTLAENCMAPIVDCDSNGNVTLYATKLPAAYVDILTVIYKEVL